MRAKRFVMVDYFRAVSMSYRSCSVIRYLLLPGTGLKHTGLLEATIGT
jgi:hypothetical protein